MWKPCVTRLDDRARRLAVRHADGDGWWPFALTILAELEDHWQTEDEPVLDRVYRSIAAGHGIYKMTSRNRFPLVDEAISRTVGEYACEEPVTIHDAAASNAITSLDLLRTLDERFGGPEEAAPVRIFASDRYDSLDLVSIPETRWIVAFDGEQRPLQVIGRNFVFHGSTPPSLRYLINRVAHLWWAQWCIKQARDALKRQIGVRRIQLFHPESVAASRSDSRFQLGYHNLFEPTARKFHIVRVMNLLTSRHLSSDQIRQGAQLCIDSLLPGGTFVFGRTMDDEDGRPRVSAVRFDQGVPSISWELNGGAEDIDLILPLQPVGSSQ